MSLQTIEDKAEDVMLVAASMTRVGMIIVSRDEGRKAEKGLTYMICLQENCRFPAGIRWEGSILKQVNMTGVNPGY
jgi:hypothetical protein